MKVLIIQENGRHEKNRNFRECFNLQRALIEKKIDAKIWGLGHENFQISFDKIVTDRDVIILLENYEQTPWLPDLSKINKLKIFWSIDSHMVLENHLSIIKKHKIDIVLHAVFSHSKNFSFTKSFWFPNAYPNDLIKPMNLEKKYDVGFCGNVANRGQYLNYISTKFNLKKDIFVIGEDMVRSINEYKIHFNRNISDDVNYRTFETLGCNTFLLTNETPGLSQLFDIGKNIITYENNDLMDKINYYLKNENERNQISKAGYEHVIQNHTFYNRAEQLISIIEQNI
jgi:hypothetical protein